MEENILEKSKRIDKEISEYCKNTLSKYSDTQIIMFALAQLIPHDRDYSFESKALHCELHRRLPKDIDLT